MELTHPNVSQQVDQIVQEQWKLNLGGISNKLLLEHVQKQMTAETDVGLLKAYIKASKMAIVYSYTEPDAAGDRQVDKEFVQQKLQERQSLRAERRFEEADRISSGLEAMGVVIDDHHKQWTLRETNATTAQDETTSNLADGTGVPCQFCGRYFASRNLVFAHLRNPVTPCGNAIFASNQTVPLPPSQKTKTNSERRRATGATSTHTEHALWVGDLPLLWTGKGYKYLGMLLRQYLPVEVPQPWIQRVHRKAYKTNGQHLGYAIVVFRDQEEMELVLGHLNGTAVTPSEVFSSHADSEIGNNLPTFTLRVKPATTSLQSTSSIFQCASIAGVDPPVADQLRPLTTQELIQRMEALGHSLPTLENVEDEHAHIVAWAADIYKQLPPRPVVEHQGRLLPLEIQAELLSILESLRWAVPNSRAGLSAERYLVLFTKANETDRHYGHLRKACQRLMDWADPNFYYSGIAVTRNFVASPHIDDRDQSFQYAVSLGDFAGGELCVDGKDANGNAALHVVNTRNRIAKVDGRHVHWVRTWTAGDNRYSLIFYDTTDRYPTPVLETGVDNAWFTE